MKKLFIKYLLINIQNTLYIISLSFLGWFLIEKFSFFALAADEDPQKKKIEKKQEKKVEGAAAMTVSSASGDEEEELTIDIQPRVERRGSSNQPEQLREDTSFF